ncbi:MAG: glutathione S-transferase family protein [Marinobacterium sp.]|nr:glutathione S-transferase family protein [Marinobacterium sp.]
MLKLVGSVPSPYVRRLRLWLDGVDHEFAAIDIYSPEGRAELEKYNPAMKIPMLLDGEQPVYDSGVIFRYLSEKLARPALSVTEENQLTLVDAFQDALILLFYAERSGLDPQQDVMICTLQRDRLERVLPLLSEQVEAGAFNGWSYPAISLYTVLDWADFRQRLALDDWPVLKAFRDNHQQQPQVAETDPR